MVQIEVGSIIGIEMRERWDRIEQIWKYEPMMASHVEGGLGF